jgi:hypothetical protein
VANGADAALLEEATPAPLAGNVVVEPSFDEATARQLVQIATDVLNELASTIAEAVAKRETGDKQFAAEEAEGVRMSERAERLIKEGGFLCAKKYSVNMTYAPEFMLSAGVVIWGGTVLGSIKRSKTKGAELRERAQGQKAA